MTGPTRIAFTDFWPDFSPEDWFLPMLRRVLGTDSVIEVQPEDEPSVLLFSVFGPQYQNFDNTSVRRVFFSGENISRDARPNDFALTFDLECDSDRHQRLPLWHLYTEDVAAVLCEDQLRRWGLSTRAVTTPKRTRFCTWVASAHCSGRNEFIQQLGAALEPVSCGGRQMNNVGGPVADKDAFLQTSRFSIAMENASRPGYCTEKLLQAFRAGCIPIYWGDPEVTRDFNPNAFINVHAFETYTALWDRIKALIHSPTQMAEMLQAPIFTEACHHRLSFGRTRWEERLVTGIIGRSDVS